MRNTLATICVLYSLINSRIQGFKRSRFGCLYSFSCLLIRRVSHCLQLNRAVLVVRVLSLLPLVVRRKVFLATCTSRDEIKCSDYYHYLYDTLETILFNVAQDYRPYYYYTSAP